MWPKPVQSPHPPVLIGGTGRRSLRLVAEQGDGWMPLVDDLEEFETGLTQLRQLCHELDRALPEVTICFGEIDEELVLRCSAHPVARLVFLAPTEDPSQLRTFLEAITGLRGRLS